MPDPGAAGTARTERPGQTRAERHPDASAIGKHGVIGNMRTVALVNTAAAVDFMCFPAFDSPTIFAAQLDPERGGAFSITPELTDARVKQVYVPDTNVLLTRFMSVEGVVEITDFMPITRTAENDPNRLIRLITVVRGTVGLVVRCAPRFDYARTPHQARMLGARSVAFTPDRAAAAARDAPTAAAAPAVQPVMQLFASVALTLEAGDAVARFTLGHKESATFILGPGAAGEDLCAPSEAALDTDPCLNATIAHWREWSARSTYRGRYREMVNRSALLLKLLSSREHGAIIAAPTFGLPETADGARRWDYRYVWIRDAAFSVYALLRLGHVDEASAFVAWTGRRTEDPAFDGRINLVYAIDGECPATEVALPSLADGHARQPPLIGNAAATQLQFDIYGALMDAVYLYNKYGTATSYKGWQHIVKIVDYVAAHWREPDAGIWEFRDAQRELLHSRLMCWVSIDRALRLAGKRSLPCPTERWTQVRSEIHQDIFDHFWNEDLQAFVQSKGSDRLDAAALMMPLVKFIAPKDPRWLSTLEAIGRHLVDDPLVYRYPPDGKDGLDGEEGSFTACSFWYAEALVRAGRVDEGRLVFEKMLGYANHLGLYSEEISAAGDPLGNFPQGLPHLALISAAYKLDKVLDRDATPWSD
ncbi:glycoside hydrolase family 15 protein [Robbsia betulipollinis]|nr:glycoside hydrolase family 15 protein [Robbsia betulipollinis]